LNLETMMSDETTTEQLAEIEGQPTEFTPPEGWRLLEVGETLTLGDEIVQSDDGRRYPTERVGSIVGANQRYIRRIERQPEPQATEFTPPDGWQSVPLGEVLNEIYIRPIEIEPEPEPQPIQVREGRWRKRSGAEVSVSAMPTDHDHFLAAFPWWDGQESTWTCTGHLLSGGECPADLVTYLGSIEEAKTQELPAKAQALPTKTQELETKTQELPAEYTPPEGWRVLAVGEALREGDVTVRKDGYCYPTERVGGWVGANQRYIRPIEPEPRPEPEPEVEPDAATIEELRSEVSYVQRLLGESNRKVTQLEDLVGSLRAINEAQEKAFEAAGKANTDLQHRLNVVAAEWAEQAETIRRLQIELDAAQQVPQAIADRFEEGWNQGTARAVETVLEWLEPIRAVDNEHLANETLQHLPQIMRSLTGLAQD